MLEIAIEALFLPGWKAVNKEQWFRNLSPERQEDHRRCGMANARHAARRLVTAIETKDVATIKLMVRVGVQRRLFEKLTGVALWKDDNAMTALIINRWAGAEAMARVDAEARRDRLTIKLAIRDKRRELKNQRLSAA